MEKKEAGDWQHVEATTVYFMSTSFRSSNFLPKAVQHFYFWNMRTTGRPSDQKDDNSTLHRHLHHVRTAPSLCFTISFVCRKYAILSSLRVWHNEIIFILLMAWDVS